MDNTVDIYFNEFKKNNILTNKIYKINELLKKYNTNKKFLELLYHNIPHKYIENNYTQSIHNELQHKNTLNYLDKKMFKIFKNVLKNKLIKNNEINVLELCSGKYNLNKFIFNNLNFIQNSINTNNSKNTKRKINYFINDINNDNLKVYANSISEKITEYFGTNFEINIINYKFDTTIKKRRTKNSSTTLKIKKENISLNNTKSENKENIQIIINLCIINKNYEEIISPNILKNLKIDYIICKNITDIVNFNKIILNLSDTDITLYIISLCNHNYNFYPKDIQDNMLFETIYNIGENGIQPQKKIEKICNDMDIHFTKSNIIKNYTSLKNNEFYNNFKIYFLINFLYKLLNNNVYEEYFMEDTNIFNTYINDFIEWLLIKLKNINDENYVEYNVNDYLIKF